MWRLNIFQETEDHGHFGILRICDKTEIISLYNLRFHSCSQENSYSFHNDFLKKILKIVHLIN